MSTRIVTVSGSPLFWRIVDVPPPEQWVALSVAA
jgi:hypothetical protein